MDNTIKEPKELQDEDLALVAGGFTFGNINFQNFGNGIGNDSGNNVGNGTPSGSVVSLNGNFFS